jgi:hypothetical protein
VLGESGVQGVSVGTEDFKQLHQCNTIIAVFTSSFRNSILLQQRYLLHLIKIAVAARSTQAAGNPARRPLSETGAYSL